MNGRTRFHHIFSAKLLREIKAPEVIRSRGVGVRAQQEERSIKNLHAGTVPGERGVVAGNPSAFRLEGLAVTGNKNRVLQSIRSEWALGRKKFKRSLRWLGRSVRLGCSRSRIVFTHVFWHACTGFVRKVGDLIMRRLYVATRSDSLESIGGKWTFQRAVTQSL